MRAALRQQPRRKRAQRAGWLAPCLGIAFILGALHTQPACAAEEELEPPRPRPRPNLEELRERLRNLTPEERQKLLNEFRERRGPGGTNRSEWEAFREELRKLPPAQREERIQELRHQLEEFPPQFRVLSPAERETKRQQMKERVTAQIKQLKAKKAEGSLTEIEERRLQRMEQMATRLEQGLVLGPRRPPAAGLPAPRRPLPSGGTNDKSNPSPTPAPTQPPPPGNP